MIPVWQSPTVCGPLLIRVRVRGRPWPREQGAWQVGGCGGQRVCAVAAAASAGALLAATWLLCFFQARPTSFELVAS